MFKNLSLIKRLLILFVLVIAQIHLLSFTASNIFNPVTLLNLLYYGSPLHGESYIVIPSIMTFTVNCIVTFYFVTIIFHRKDYKHMVLSYIISLILLMWGYHLFLTDFYYLIYRIDNTKMADSYYAIYHYGQAFRYILGYLLMQIIVLVLYYLLELTKCLTLNSHNTIKR